MTDNKTCMWSEDGCSSPWASACGHYFEFNEGGPTDNGFKFCPFCGRTCEEIPYENDDE